ncbi:MAG TPA: hypothetical protein VFF30_12780 [Nitrososphaerales archaeon]|nr:hypothetical protein [Nitrososphaerales archaeon]
MVVISSHMNKRSGTLILRLDAGNEDRVRDYAKIEDSLCCLDGIMNVKVNYSTDMIRIEFDPKKLTFEEIRNALDKAQERNSKFRSKEV